MIQILDSNLPAQEPESAPGRILVTGANGFIGVKVVENLLDRGASGVRCLVRPSSQREHLRQLLEEHPAGRSVELVEGDLLSRTSCDEAVRGVSIIYHLAAGFEKSFAGAFMNSALATRNLIEAYLQHGQPRRFLNVSSFAVYSNLHLRRGQLMDERCPLEDAPQERFDPYGFGKLEQEKLVRFYGAEKGLPYVILRPGAVFGPGKTELSGRIGIRTFGFFMQIGGGHLIPLTYVDNCADAIVLAGFAPGVEGEIFNVVDDDLLTGKEFLQIYRRKLPQFTYFRVPYWLGYLFSAAWERYARESRGQLPPVFNRRRCVAEWKPKRFTNEKLRKALGWEPKVGMKEAMERFLAQFEPQQN